MPAANTFALKAERAICPYHAAPMEIIEKEGHPKES